jgi:hypothetical protein
MGQGQEEGEEEKVRECSFYYISRLLTHAKPLKAGAGIARCFQRSITLLQLREENYGQAGKDDVPDD